MLATPQNISFALEFADSDLAMKILKETHFGESLPVVNGIVNHRSKLLATAFPELPDNLATEVMQRHLLEFYRLGISFRDHLTNRYLFQGRVVKNEQQAILLKSIRQNSEVLAGKTIGEWVHLFDQIYPPEERTQEEILPFCTKILKDSSQSEQQIAVLKDILGVYETLLTTQLIDIIDTTLALKNIRREKGTPEQDLPNVLRRTPSTQTKNLNNDLPQSRAETQQKNMVRLSLKKAVEKYPRIMNERVTDSDIVFRGSDGPVIPSVKNWITAYHQEMGSGTHEPYERSEFLFHNKSAMSLSQRERTVLSEVLRSLDEESELPINPETQSIDLLQLEQLTVSSTNTSSRQLSKQEVILPSASSQNIPAAERSAASLYTREPIDDRKDAWHTADTQNATPRSSKYLQNTSFSQNLTGGIDPRSRQNPSQTLQRPSAENTAQNWQDANVKKPTITNPNLKSIQMEEKQKEWEAPRSFPAQPQVPPLQASHQHGPINPTARMQQTPRSATPLPQTDHLDYTDYYPIPKEPKRPTQSIPSNLSFSSPHTFPVEKIEKQSLAASAVSRASQQNIPNNRPQQPQRQPLSTAKNSQNPTQNLSQKQQPKRMIIG